MFIVAMGMVFVFWGRELVFFLGSNRDVFLAMGMVVVFLGRLQKFCGFFHRAVCLAGHLQYPDSQLL